MSLLMLLAACSSAPEPPALPTPDPPSAQALASEAPATQRLVPMVTDAADFKRRHAESWGKTPEGAVKAFTLAVLMYGSDDASERAIGKAALSELVIPFRDDPQWEQRGSRATFVDRIRDPAYRHLWRSYAVGARPENGYQMDPADFEIAVDRVVQGEGGMEVWLVSGGADSPRKVLVKRSTKSGLYYMYEFPNFYVGIRSPIDEDEERFE